MPGEFYRQPGADEQKGVLAESHTQINLNSTSRKKGLDDDGPFHIPAYLPLLS